MSAVVKLRPRELGVGEVARMRGIDRETARRWLKELEAKHGTAVVYQRAGRYYTTDLALKPFLPIAPSTEATKALNSHEERILDLERRVEAEVCARLEFQRKALSYFQRIEAIERRLSKVI